MAVMKKISMDDVSELSIIASNVVKEHFDPIIGSAQNDYMISKFQSPQAIREQLTHGYRYYWLLEDDVKAGFCAFFPRNGKMYLSKFYILQAFRGRHLARKMFSFIVEETKAESLNKIFLNVNRENSSVIAVYEHLGFKKIREEKTDIGQGFYMDDYVMEYSF